MNGLYERLCDRRDRRGGCFFLLLDPDRVPEERYLSLAEAAEECGVDALLVGTSFSLESQFTRAVGQIRLKTTLPLILFPGSFAQITPHADAILFTSLLSGRNPTYLIDEQMRGAPLVKQSGLEPIPTGYLLIESGSLTSVQYISGSLPIPREKHDIACAHALAAQYMGMKLVYLEAGSGANGAVPDEMVAAVSAYVSIPVMVGGGIRTPEACADKIESGASFVVVGTRFEHERGFSLLREMAAATHPLETIDV